MGGAKAYLKKKYAKPRKAWEKDRIEAERKIVQDFGIKRKRELRRMEWIMKSLKRRARALIGRPDKEEERALLEKAHKLGIVERGATLDDVLKVAIEDILERRLQTQLVRKGFAATLKQARQFIVHGHITVNGQKTVSPAYIVKRGDEAKIAFAKGSPLETKYQLFVGKRPAAPAVVAAAAPATVAAQTEPAQAAPEEKKAE